jgi:alpha-L-fucosidase
MTPFRFPMRQLWPQCTVVLGLGVLSLQALMATSAQAQTSKAVATVAAPVKEETPAQHDARMRWWREARFGMFIHWGLYAVPAGVYNGREVPGAAEWIMGTAKIPVPEYEKYAPQFNPTQFDAKAWVQLAKDAGMKYIVVTSKHHEGFAMFNTKVNNYNILQATPWKRDPLKEISAACRQAGLRFGIYYSIMDWHHPDANAAGAERYIPQMKAQLREIITQYQPAVLWFDGEWVPWWSAARGQDLENFVRALKPDVIINNRIGKRGIDDGDYETPEQEIPASRLGRDWETCMTMNNTWGFKANDHNWKSTTDLLHKLTDIASKGGNFLLNVGPTAEGVIPQPSVERLQQVGTWLRRHGDSVYGTSAGPFRALAWGRVTQKPNRLYAHVWNVPQDRRLTFPGLQAQVTRAYLLNVPQSTLKVVREANDVIVTLPAATSSGAAPLVVTLETRGVVSVENTQRQAADGSLSVIAANAEVQGKTLRYESGEGKDNLGFWTNEKDWARWDVQIDRPGTYRVEATYACDAGNAGSRYEVEVAGQKVQGEVADTGAWNTFVTREIGTITLLKTGRSTVAVRVLNKPKAAVMNLRSISLKPVTP